ncbi:MAG: aspartate/glutamate racemase family protein [Erysipelotrichaceae bacterium]
MKTIGLIGGMSWESTIPYYRILNETVRDTLGGYHSAKILLYSVDFDEIERDQSAGEWERMGETLGNIALTLQNAGAEAIVLCTNTMHKVSDAIEAKIHIPFIHIADATADAVLDAGLSKVALLGTKYTMAQDFYKDRLASKGLIVIIPNAEDQEFINHVIFEELIKGKVLDTSRTRYLEIIDKLVKQGAEGVILGCTEIGILITPQDTDVKLFETVEIHAKKAAKFLLQD